MTAPSVSVITPTYNRAHLLPRVWRSLSGCTDLLEWIVVDDASADSTVEVVGELRDPRIRYIRLEHNRGNNAARNAGVCASRGTFVIFLDSDDELVPEGLPVAIDAIAASSQDIGAVLMIASISSSQGSRPSLPDRAVLTEADLVLQGRLRGDRAVIYKREVFRNQLLPDEFRGCEQIFVFGITRWWNYLVINKPLTLVHRDGGNFSEPTAILRLSGDIARSWEVTIENHRAILCKDPTARVNLYIRVLYRYSVAGEWDSVRRVIATIRKDHPGPLIALKAISVVTAGFVGRCGAEHFRLKFLMWLLSRYGSRQ